MRLGWARDSFGLGVVVMVSRLGALLALGALLTLFILWAPLQMGVWADPGFFPSLVANVWADFFVGVILVFAIREVVSRTKSMELAVILRVERSSQSEHTLRFAVKNIGGIAFRREDIGFHVFIAEGTPVARWDSGAQATRLDPKWVSTRTGTRVYDWSGIIKQPLFVGETSEDFLILGGVSSPEKGSKYVFHYYLSTPEGSSPRSPRFDRQGSLYLESLGMIELLPDLSVLHHRGERSLLSKLKLPCWSRG